MCCFPEQEIDFIKIGNSKKFVFNRKVRSKIMLETSMFESSENHTKMIPKWSQNPSKILQKSIPKSRSEKGRPKIDKNRGLGRPRLENLAPGVADCPASLAFLARGPPRIEGLKDRGLKGVISTRPVAWRIIFVSCLGSCAGVIFPQTVLALRGSGGQ